MVKKQEHYVLSVTDIDQYIPDATYTDQKCLRQCFAFDHFCSPWDMWTKPNYFVFTVETIAECNIRILVHSLTAGDHAPRVIVNALQNTNPDPGPFSNLFWLTVMVLRLKGTPLRTYYRDRLLCVTMASWRLHDLFDMNAFRAVLDLVTWVKDDE